jgi:hypothetical protein
LLWRCDNRLYWELDWIKELLGDLSYVDKTSETVDIFADHVLVCDNRLSASKNDFYRAAYKKGCRIHLIHLSDESYEDDCSAYRWCDAIFRNYNSSELAENSKVVTFAPGYKIGFAGGLKNLPAAERAFIWSFAGHRRVPSRVEMLDALTGLRPSKAHLTGGFNAPEGLSLEDYRDLLQTTLFAPCLQAFRPWTPSGCMRRWKPDAYRLSSGDGAPTISAARMAPTQCRP